MTPRPRSCSSTASCPGLGSTSACWRRRAIQLVPLLERLKFLAIVASNLDEFFMVRVAGLKQQLSGNVAETPPDGLTAGRAARGHQHARPRAGRRAVPAWRDEIEPGLAQTGIRRLAAGRSQPGAARLSCRAYFAREVCPVLTPLAVDPGHPFPHLRNRSLNLAVFMHREKEKVGRRETMVAVVQVPSVLPRITRCRCAVGDGVTALAADVRFASCCSRT